MHTFSSYDQAMTRLRSIGGVVLGPFPVGDDYLEGVTVSVAGSTLSRTEHVPYGVQGGEREAALRKAVREACEESRAAGAEQMVRGTRRSQV